MIFLLNISGSDRGLRPGTAGRAAASIALVVAGLFLVSCAEGTGPGREPPEPTPVSGFMTVEGSRLFYETLGEGLPLVLIHGGLLDMRMWDEDFTWFGDRFRTVRYDVRGHGRSAGSATPYSDTGDLLALLDHLEIDRAVIMGLSMGGGIAVDFTLEHPDRVCALIPVSSGLSGYDFAATRSSPHFGPMMEAFERGDFDQATEYFQRMWTDGPDRSPDQVDPGVRSRVRNMIMERHRPDPGQAESSPPDPPARGRLAEINVPVLVLVGDRDMPDIYSIADLMMKEIPGAKQVIIPEAAHMVNLEQPGPFRRAVEEFLAGITCPG